MLVAIATAIALPVGVARRDLRERVRAEAAIARPGEALARRPERLPVDRDRDLRLRAASSKRRPDPRHRPPPERLGGRVRALDHHAPARLADDDGGARARAEPPPRGELRARRLEVADGARASCCPSALGGIVTGTTLAVARAAGETAPLLFTCSIFGADRRAPTRRTPVASIPVIIFEYSESPDKNLNAQAWAAAFVLIMFVLVTSLARAARCSTARAASSARAG